QAPPPQNHADLVRVDDRDPRRGVQKEHQGNPPVHPPPRGIDQPDDRRRQVANLGRRPRLSHYRSLAWSSENGSESVRKINEVLDVTSLSSDSMERVRR